MAFAGLIRFALPVGVAVWQGYIWMVGPRHVHALTQKQAALSAGAVTGFLLLVAAL